MSKIRTTIQHEKCRVPAVAILVGLCCLLTYYFHWVLGIDIVFSHFFYIPIILATMWWKKKGLVVAIFLVLFMLASYTLSHPELDWNLVNNLVRAAFFIIVGTTVSILSERMKKTENRLNDHAKNLEKMVEERTKEIKKFSDAVKASTESIVITDLEGRIIDVNEATLKMHGTDNKEDLVGKSSFDLFPPEDLQKAVAAMKEVLEKGYVKDRGHVIVKDGSKLPVEISVSIMKGIDGEPIGFVGVTTDITERVRAEEEILQRTARLTVINRISAAVSSTLDLNDILSTITQQMAEFFAVEHSGILMFDKEKEWGYVLAEYPDLDATAERFKVKGFLAAERVIADQKPVMIEDTLKDPLMAKVRDTMRRLGVKSMLIVPLVVKGETIGSIGLDAIKERRVFSQEDIELAQTIANQVSMSIENARLYEEANRRISELELLHRATLAVVSSTLELDTALQEVVTLLATQLNFPHVGIALVDEDSKQIVLCAEHGIQRSRWGLTGQAIQVGQGLVGWVVQHGEPLLVNDVSSDQRYIVGIPETRSELVVPLRVGEQVIGVINVESPHLNAFDLNNQRLLTTLAGQVAIAIDNAQQYAAEQRRAVRLAALQRLIIELAGLREESAVLHTLVTRTAVLAGSPTCTVMLVDEKTNEVVLAEQTGLPEGTLLGLRVPLTLPIIHRSLETGEPIIVPNIDRDAPELRTLLVRQDIHAFFAYPMMLEDRVLGCFTLSSLTPRRPSAEEITAYSLLAERAAVALENARLYAALERHATRLKVIGEIGQQIASVFDLDELLHIVVAVLVERFGYYYANILLVDAPAGEIVLLASAGQTGRARKGFRLKIGQQGIIGWVAGTGQPLLVNDVTQEPRYYFAEELKDTLSELAVPIMGKGQVIGVMDVQSVMKDAFDEDDLFTLQTLADRTAAGIENARLYQETNGRLAELSVLFEVSSSLRGTKNVDEMLPVILKATIKAVHSDAGTILLLDSAGDPSHRSGQALVVRAAQGQMAHLLGSRLPIDDNMIGGYVLKTREPYIIQHVATEPLIPVVLREHLQGIETVVVLPLQVGETAVGVMNIAYTTQHAFSEAELRLLTTITDMAASAIHRAGLFEQLEHRVHELAALFEMGRLITASMRIEDVLALVVQVVVRNFQVEGSWIHLWDERQNRLVLQAVEGFQSDLVGTHSYRAGEGLTGWVFLEGRVANVPDLAADPRWKREPEYEAALLSGLAKNALVTPLIVSTRTLGVLGVVNKIGVPIFTESDQLLLTTLAGQVAITIENARLYEDVRSLSITTVRSLAAAIDARDPYTRGHSEEVTRLAVQLARELGWNGADLEMLEFAALLHDVGKIAVPDHILRKVEPLTPDEWNIIRLHPYHSAQIVKPIESLQRIIPWIYHHQERWAGTGYPDGLKGEDIPLASRIIAVADAFNAMTSDRPYRKALSVKQALAEIKRCADKQFDPQVAEAFLRQVAGE